jgi:hypothetical protein
MKTLTVTVTLLLLSAMIAVAEETQYKSYPCIQCHYATVIEESTGTVTEVTRGNYKFRETRMKRICDGCGYYWYGTSSECLGRVYGNSSTDRSGNVQQSTDSVSQVANGN